MGAHIEAVRALTSRGLRRPTARGLADAAARSCFASAGRDAGDVDMLINTGIYREDNMGEPALAALIQEDIGANLGQPPLGGRGTFSFDLLNGTCGVISAIQLESGLLRSGVIRLGAIVTSDVGPKLKDSGSAPFRAAGGAMLLAWDDTRPGSPTSARKRFPSTRICS
jgi:3-oxoacyl-[acyl-carrier-protein] synthase-3